MRNKASVVLCVLLFGISVSTLLIQASYREEFPGNYPAFEAPVAITYDVQPDVIRLIVSPELNGQRIIAYAYDKEGRMYGVLKPVVNGVVTISKNDYADIEVEISGRKITGYELLKRVSRYERQVPMFELFRAARNGSLRRGIQRCLYPVCTRCLAGCLSVISGGDIPLQMEVGPDGAIYPVYAKGKCPRCGKCFKWCPVQVITDSRARR